MAQLRKKCPHIDGTPSLIYEEPNTSFAVLVCDYCGAYTDDLTHEQELELITEFDLSAPDIPGKFVSYSDKVH